MVYEHYCTHVLGLDVLSAEENNGKEWLLRGFVQTVDGNSELWTCSICPTHRKLCLVHDYTQLLFTLHQQSLFNEFKNTLPWQPFTEFKTCYHGDHSESLENMLPWQPFTLRVYKHITMATIHIP